MTQLVFQETQRFRQIWIWAVLLGVTGITLGSLFFLKRESPLSFTDFAFPLGMLLLVNGLFYSFTLSTRITRDRLSFRFFPFIQWRSYHFEEVESLELVAYNGLWDYGGWGIKWNGDTWSYTTGGKWGLLLKTRDKKILLGTQNPDEIKQALAHFTAFKLAEKD
jgi:hypothetical protein